MSYYNDRDNRLTVDIVCFAVVCLGFGFLLGNLIGKANSKEKAIEAGVAKYIVDERTGSTQFVFITNSIPAK